MFWRVIEFGTSDAMHMGMDNAMKKIVDGRSANQWVDGWTDVGRLTEALLVRAIRSVGRGDAGRIEATRALEGRLAEMVSLREWHEWHER